MKVRTAGQQQLVHFDLHTNATQSLYADRHTGAGELMFTTGKGLYQAQQQGREEEEIKTCFNFHKQRKLQAPSVYNPLISGPSVPSRCLPSYVLDETVLTHRYNKSENSRYIRYSNFTVHISISHAHIASLSPGFITFFNFVSRLFVMLTILAAAV